MKRTIRDYDLKDKRVIIRVDFNVPIKDGKITDDNRIVESLDTIKYAVDKDAKVILMSHLGRIKSKEDLEKNSLKIVANRLSELLEKPVLFVGETRSMVLEERINSLKPGEVLLMENTRFQDLDGKKESSNDEALGRYWASLGDIFINDAFGTSHRAHASNVGIGSRLPNGIGFLIERELKYLEPAINNPKRPLTVILGGSKVSDKIGLIENLMHKADYILVGGGMAFTFLKAKGYEIGKSLLDEDNIDFCESIINIYDDKVIIPTDVVVANEISDSAEIKNVSVTDIEEDKIGVDIGEETIKLFEKYISKSNTIIWNGPVGIFEYEKFSKGTKELARILSQSSATTIIGGGDTGSAIGEYKDKIDHISTGGGASLELLEGKSLPGIEIIEDK